MTRILIFAGTTEGRRLAEYLKRAGAEVLVSVATEYGETAFEEDDRIKVHAGRMDLAEMKGFLRREELSLVVDATHPYAQVVSANTIAAYIADKKPGDTVTLTVYRSSTGESLQIDLVLSENTGLSSDSGTSAN